MQIGQPKAMDFKSRLARNTQLLKESPALFARKLATWLRPMRKEYRRRWNRGLRRWLIQYETDLVFRKVNWMGVPAWKNVLDAWVYQEIVYEVRPQIIVEIGNACGGSALYLANLLDLLGSGEVIAVDIDHTKFQPRHPRISLVTGDSLAPETLARVESIAGSRRGMVIDDADHSRKHTLGNLRTYARFVCVGGYFIVEDTVIDLFRAGDGLGSVDGPLGAVEEFVAEDDRFRIDPDREYFVLTYNPRGYLKRVR
jgi:cephalosporin hydroxylase